MTQPMQPIYRDPKGVIRFHPNAIVQALLDAASAGRKLDMNGIAELALSRFSQDDQQHFAQLIGYSLFGFGELSYVTDEVYDQAEQQAGSLLTHVEACKA